MTLSLCFTFSFAQDAKTVNNVYKTYGSLINLRDSLGEKCKHLKEMDQTLSDSLIKVSKRNRFTPSNSSESIKNNLLSYKTLKDFEDSTKLGNLIKKLNLLKNESWKESYFTLLEMVEALYYGGYNKKTNDDQKKLIGRIQLLKDHEKLKDEVCNNIKDYRFVMFELARVIRLSQTSEIYKKIESSQLYDTLYNARETEYIDKIPYTQRKFKIYCSQEDKRKEILTELHKSCPEAFPNN